MIKQYNKTMGLLQCFAILFVVLGHMESNILTIDNWFPYYSFHMPLFVFISGYFYETDSENHVIEYIKRKSIRLLVPFYVWNFIYLLIQTCLNQFGFSLGNNFSWYTFIIWPWTHNQPIGFNVASWFIIALYIVLIVNCITRKILSFVKHKELVVFALYLFIGCFCLLYLRNNTPCESIINIMRSLFLLLFFQVGYVYKKYLEPNDVIKNTSYFLIIFIITGFLKIKFGNLNYSVFKMDDFQPNMLVIYSSTFLGIAFWMRIAKLLTPIMGSSILVTLISKNTFGIMMHHLFACFIIKTVIAVLNIHLYTFQSFDLFSYSHLIYYIYAPFWETRFYWSVAAIVLSLVIVKIQFHIICKARLCWKVVFNK